MNKKFRKIKTAVYELFKEYGVVKWIIKISISLCKKQMIRNTSLPFHSEIFSED